MDIRRPIPAVLGMLLASVVFATVASSPVVAGEEAAVVRQPVFLLCPYREKFSAWSLYLNVDRNDPSRIVSLGLEKLIGQNSKDYSYDAVLQAQHNPSTRREVLGILPASEFGRGKLEVKKDDALEVNVTPATSGDLRLMISMRISADGRFVIGGKEQGKRDVLLRYDPQARTWGACAATLIDTKGKAAVSGGCQPMSGIAFPVISTGIFRIVGVVNGMEPVILLDRR